MPQCCAYGCFNRQDVRGGKLFHKIPSGRGNEDRRKIWIHRIGRKNWTAPSSARLCEDHFEKDAYEQNRADGEKKLKPNALPTIFKHRPMPKYRKPPKERKSLNIEESAIKFLSDLPEKPLQSLDNMEAESPEDINKDGVFCDSAHNEKMKNVGTQCNLPSSTEIEYEEKIKDLQRKLNLAYKDKANFMKEKENLSENIKNLFTNDQIRFLEKNKLATGRWSEETIRKALHLRVVCGTTAYQYMRNKGYPLPSERTLQERMAGIKFPPGILMEIMPSLKAKVEHMNEMEKEAILMIDEMSITTSLEYDSSIGIIIGRATLCSATGSREDMATHALVFMIGGMSTRWKQVVAYHFTPNSFSPKELKNFTFNLIRVIEDHGIRINAIVLDMGGQNQGFLRECGIIAGRYSVTINNCCHPASSERRLYFLYDAPHIFKNIRNHLTNDQVIILPPEIISKYNLPPNEVSIQQIRQLMALDEEVDLKVAPNLRQSVLAPNHYDKMKVGLALALLNHSVAAAIEYYVEKKKMERNALTTAWFIKTLFFWFKTMTSRSRNLALSHFVEEKHLEATEKLKEIIFLFENIRIGPSNVWKPVQTAVILSTKSVLELQELFLENKGYNFLFLSRLSQDALENLFSMIRFKNPVPTWYLEL